MTASGAGYDGDRHRSQGDLRVLIWGPGLERTPEGGHRVQLLRTAESLERFCGIEVVTSQDPAPCLDRVDVVHGFGLDTHHVRRARSLGIPVVLSPIYCSKTYQLTGPGSGRRLQDLHQRMRTAASLARSALAARHHATAERIVSWVSRTRALYESVDLLLPNSVLEAQTIADELGVSTPMHVVPNAVDPSFLQNGSAASRQGVLMVGRFEPHKNQLGLIRACQKLDVPLSLVGPRHPDHTRYFEICRQTAGSSVTFYDSRPQEALKALYGRAAVHALPSYYETTGLVSLEAALAGCQIVMTSRGYTREYFADHVDYCEPEDVQSIVDALRHATGRTQDTSLQQRILSRFTWEHTARESVAGYRRLLRSSPDPA